MKRSNASMGIMFIVLSSVLFAPLSQTATKFLAGEFPIFQIMFFRALGQTTWMFLFFWPKHGFGMFRSANLPLQLTRSTLLFVSSIFWIKAIAVVPLTTASAINFTAPILVVMLSIPLLGEKVGLHRWGAVALGFVGALIVIQPSSEGVPTAVLWLIGAAFLFALYQILTRKLAAVDSEATSAIYTILVSLFVSACVVPWHYQSPVGNEALAWGAFAATGLLGGLRHFFVVKAYALAPASVISPFFYGELIGVTLLGFLVFGDLPTTATWIGAAVIISSGLYIAHRERIRR